MPSYYQDQNFINIAYAVDIVAENHFSDMLFKGDSSRVIYASNEFAMRERARQAQDNVSTSNLNLPFMNYRTDDYRIDGSNPRWHVRAYTSGAYIPAIKQNIVYAPLIIEYQSTFWCNRDDDLRYAFNELHFDSGNKTTLVPTVSVAGETVELTAWLSYNNLEFDPEYNETDWLEKNNIHSAVLDFQIETFALKSNENIILTEEVVFDFAAKHGLEEGTTYDDAYTFIVDHLNETVTQP
ncbi:MAG TPA: hypothetical protein VE912_15740 [Bacteroidales bacterium]|nr:hypothetical protein [Bacteroidales bacterium]